MRRYLMTAMAGLALAGSIALSASPVRADSNSPITITLQPIYTLNDTGDASTLPAGFFSTNGTPKTTNDWEINYGISYRLDKRSSISYMHENSDFSLGALSAGAPVPSVGNPVLLTGDIRDRIDTISYNYGFGHGLSGSVYYQSHQRMNVAGLCLNQESCTTPDGGSISNPASINETVYGLGAKYSFLHLAGSAVPLLTLNFDVQYVPRPAFNAAGAGTGGFPAGTYVSSGFMFPYGATLNVPILPKSWGAMPFASYQRASVWWKAENTPEVFNVLVYGIAKTLAPNLTLAVTQTKFNGCFCSDTVPPPDNIRFAIFGASLTYLLKP